MGVIAFLCFGFGTCCFVLTLRVIVLSDDFTDDEGYSPTSIILILTIASVISIVLGGIAYSECYIEDELEVQEGYFIECGRYGTVKIIENEGDRYESSENYLLFGF